MVWAANSRTNIINSSKLNRKFSRGLLPRTAGKQGEPGGTWVKRMKMRFHQTGELSGVASSACVPREQGSLMAVIV
jgi:hypothetical protein